MSHHLDYIAQLQSQLPHINLLTDPKDTIGFCEDQRRRFVGHVFAVVLPKNTQEVQEIVRFCSARQIPLTPQSGNTSLCGGATPSDEVAGLGIIVSLAHMNRVREVNLADNCLTVEAGMILSHVQATAKEHNRLFPLSMASEGSCQIGGNIACNAGGLNVLRYGTARDLVMGLEVVLPNGEVIDHLEPLHKNTTGFDSKQLFIGSEGCYGIITAASLKLFALPKTTVTAWVNVNSIEEAVALLSLMQGHFAERLTSFELISDFALSLSSHFSQLPKPNNDSAWSVLLELSDSLSLPELPDWLMQCLWDNGFQNAVIAQSESEREQLWTLRENISAAQRDLGVSIKHDIAIPIKSVAAFVASNMPKIQAAYPEAKLVVFGHLGDGSLHYNVFLNHILNNEVYVHEDKINAIVYQSIVEFSGTIAAEHGIGQLKKEWLKVVRTPEELSLMRILKQHLDPQDLFNRGKVIPE